VRYSILCNGGDLQSTIYACFSWEIALNFVQNVSFYNILDWKEMQEGSEEVNIRKAGILSDICFR
jgi:hypothetical protein